MKKKQIIKLVEDYCKYISEKNEPVHPAHVTVFLSPILFLALPVTEQKRLDKLARKHGRELWAEMQANMKVRDGE